MAINKVIYGNSTLIDLTGDTVTSSDHIMNGYIGHLADGSQVTGTGQGGGGSAQTIYCGTSAPSSSIGANGDLYMKMNTDTSLVTYPSAFTSSGMNSTSNASKCIGVSADDGNATGNMYSSGSSTTGIVDYTFDVSSVPSGATITSVECKVMAHEENSSRSTFTLQLYSGDTAKGSSTTVNGTSNTIYTLTCGTWTRAELDDIVLHTTYGYYGGLVAGATLTVSYEATPEWNATLTGTSSNMTITASNMYIKSSGSWTQTESTTLSDLIARG